MAKETCSNCYVKLPPAASFCPTCERPTRHATDSERLEWDLKQWRAHVDRSIAAGMNPNARAVGGETYAGVVIASDADPAPIAPAARIAQHVEPAAYAEPVTQRIAPRPTRAPDLVITPPPATAEPSKPARRSMGLHLPRLTRGKKAPVERNVVIDLDADHEFAYRACATCQATDWIVRTGRNDEATWNYWCVRCSRAFKTEVRLRSAVKPFLASGIVVGGIAAASMLMLR